LAGQRFVRSVNSSVADFSRKSGNHLCKTCLLLLHQINAQPLAVPALREIAALDVALDRQGATIFVMQ
jgi:hypothetical protein